MLSVSTVGFKGSYTINAGIVIGLPKLSKAAREVVYVAPQSDGVRTKVGKVCVVVPVNAMSAMGFGLTAEIAEIAVI